MKRIRFLIAAAMATTVIGAVPVYVGAVGLPPVGSATPDVQQEAANTEDQWWLDSAQQDTADTEGPEDQWWLNTPSSPEPEASAPSTAPAAVPTTPAPDGGITVMIDGRHISFGDVPAQIINDRTMVPVRALADELGAHTEWNEENQSVLLTRGNRYATLRIGAPMMLYGEFTRGDNGSLAPTSTEHLELDSPPVIVDDRSLFPLSAIVTAFGVDFEWIEESRTVVISTGGSTAGADAQGEWWENLATAPPAGTTDEELANLPVVSPPTETHAAFADIPDVFQQISGSHAQALRASNQQFAMVVFNSDEPDSVRDVPMLVNAARQAGYRLYGVNIRPTERFQSPQALTWLWDETSRGQYPILVFSFRNGQHQIIRDFPPHGDLVEMFENILLDFPVMPGGQGTQQNNQDQQDNQNNQNESNDEGQQARQPSTFSWNRMTFQESQQHFNDNNAFIVFFYDSEDYDITRITNMIRRLGENHRVPVHYVDMATASAVSTSRWTNQFGSMRTPSLFFVRHRGHVMTRMGLTLADERQMNSMFVDFRNFVETNPN